MRSAESVLIWLILTHERFVTRVPCLPTRGGTRLVAQHESRPGHRRLRYDVSS